MTKQMIDLQKAAKQALDFLMTRRMGAEAVIEALNTALAQPPLPVQPEPLEYWNAVEGWVKIESQGELK